jgi:Prokaryotic dksA/traR C4-type zinc finger
MRSLAFREPEDLKAISLTKRMPMPKRNCKSACMADSHLLRAIDEALARMRRGTDGACKVCKQRIPKVRLEAVPWTRHCRDCKEHEHPAAQMLDQRRRSIPAVSATQILWPETNLSPPGLFACALQIPFNYKVRIFPEIFP